jgi:hypothetical protein
MTFTAGRAVRPAQRRDPAVPARDLTGGARPQSGTCRGGNTATCPGWPHRRGGSAASPARSQGARRRARLRDTRQLLPIEDLSGESVDPLSLQARADPRESGTPAEGRREQQQAVRLRKKSLSLDLRWVYIFSQALDRAQPQMESIVR